jgi:DNA-binding transcriptional MerR regulator
MRIGDFAAAAGVAPSLVRYYEARGVMPAPGRVAGTRTYESAALERLRAVLVARRLGLSLTEIKTALISEGAWAEVAAARAAVVECEIRQLRVKRALLAHAARSGALLPERYARMLTKIGA